MRILTLLTVVLTAIALAACSGARDDTGQSHRGQSGPYVGGSAGVGF
ncbi:MAG TPA: hypothetical protein VHB27_05645 [Rhodopila sp.]|nr:hypothetical protein [Rhodopila sp.]HVY14689.1 hypothetical protein [Rhodopila sp.]